MINPRWQNSRSLGGAAQGTLNLSRGYDISNDFDRLLKANATYASVPVPSSGYATMDTSCRAVASTPNLPYDMNLAQISAIKTALPPQVAAVANDALMSLKQAFPQVLFA